MLDGAGCLAAAGALIASHRVGDLVHPSRSWRRPTTAALAATSAVLLAGSVSDEPSPAVLRGSALVNAGWVAVCATALSRPLPTTGRALVATTAALDAAVGTAQWLLQASSGTSRERSTRH